LEGNSDVTSHDFLSILANYPSHLLRSVKGWLDSICRQKQRPFHVQKPVMRVAIRMHSSFGRRDASIESLDILDTLWTRLSSRKDCASLWLQFRLRVVVRVGQG
jgi:hypothetical protein